MVSQTIFLLAACGLFHTRTALAGELNEESCSLVQDGNCIVEQNYVSLLQANSHFAAVGRDHSLENREAAEAEARRAFTEIRDQLHQHPKVAKRALHEALIEVQHSSWPFTTGANQLFSPESTAAKAAGKAADKAADKASKSVSATDGEAGSKKGRKLSAPVAAVQQHEQPSEETASIAKPVEPEDPDSKPLKPADGAQIAPFGKEDTARELTQHAVDTQDTLVDAVENAEVAEVKRAVFRSLTRLRAASIKEFDTIARLETQAFDEYNDAHHYRAENPLDYLHSSEPKVREDKYSSFH